MTARPANNLYHLLTDLLSRDETDQWVGATVLTKYRSSYRKPGAMMLVSPFGQIQGLVSGGCLESDVVLRARRVLEYGRPEYVIYDSMEEGNIAAELGLGCNGRIGVLVEEITAAHRQLYLELLERMRRGEGTHLVYRIDGEGAGLQALLEADMVTVAARIGPSSPLPAFTGEDAAAADLLTEGESRWAVIPVKPPVRLLIVGGGIDAQPVAELAARLGWRVTVADQRIANARQRDFPLAETLVDQPPEELETDIRADAVIIMSHNLHTDARWLAYCPQLLGVKYVGLLGPTSRKTEVLELAGLADDAEFAGRIHGPMGIDIGGDLPESVAISAIAECHQVLARAGLL